jgi:hypothetical protein
MSTAQQGKRRKHDPSATFRQIRAHLTGLPSQSEAMKVAVGFIPRMDITNDDVA